MNPDSFDTSDQSQVVSNQSPPPQSATQQASAPDPSNSPQTQPAPAGQNSQPQASPNPTTAPSSPAAPLQGTVSNQPNAQNGSNTVSNSQPYANHPLVKSAGVKNAVLRALVGDPQQTTILPDGTITRQPAPLSKWQLGMGIALEAVSGALSGLAQSGPNANSKAALAGFNQAQTAQQQRDQAEQAQAQAQSKQRSDQLMAQAQAFELNSRTALNTAQSQRMGVESLKDAVNQNEKLLQDFDDQRAITDKNVSEDELKAGMANGKYDSTNQIAIPDGFTNVNGRFEQTFSVIDRPSETMVPLSNQQVQDFARAGIPGFLPYRDGTKIVDDMRVPSTVVARANAQLQALNLMKQDAQTVQDTLVKSSDKDNQELAKSIPDLQTLLDDPKRGAGLFGALQRWQRYLSHSAPQDFAESLHAMAAPSKPDPNDPKKSIPNPDAPFAQTIYGAFGNGDPAKGRAILAAYSSETAPLQISSEAQAADMIASSIPGSRAYRYAQSWIASNTAQKAAVARAGAQARQDAKPVPATPATLTTPDALGFVPNVSDIKEYNKRQDSFKKNADALATTEGSFQQFNNALASINQGNFTGAQSVVALFDSIGLSATPLAGKGFRVNQNTIAEHAQARGWEQALQQKLLSAKSGDIITPQQVKDYASIANQARISQYINLVNQVHNSGLNANFVLPTGNGQKIDPGTAKIFLTLAGNNPQVARQAATVKGWQF